MKIIILHPRGANHSARSLAGALKCDIENPFQTGRRDFRAYDLVINYGCNRNIKANAIVNNASSVARCIDKFTTFSLLQDIGIPVPNFTTDKAIAQKWETVVVRKNGKAAANEGMEYHYPANAPLPDAPLYTEYFEHTKEFRVVVINGITSSVYEKVREGNEWAFYERSYKYLQPIKETCEAAANLLKIQYVGFDVLMNAGREFVILEANSAPILTEDTIKEFKRLINLFDKEMQKHGKAI